VSVLPHLVVPTDVVAPQWSGEFDLYLPDSGSPAPVVVLVHGLFQEPPAWAPRESQFFRAYATQLVERGVAAVMFDHELTGGMRYPEAATSLERVLGNLRTRDDVDVERVGVWFFSGGGPLCYPVMADAQPWLRVVGLTYPLLPHEPIPNWPTQKEAVHGIGERRVVFTKVGQEIPDFVAGQQAFLDAGVPNLTVIDVPDAAHGFDAMEPTTHGVAAVRRALDLVAEHVVS